MCVLQYIHTHSLSLSLSVKFKAELTYYSHTDPSSTLSGIKDFMNIHTTFGKAKNILNPLKALPPTLTSSPPLAEKRKQGICTDFDYNWRNILASEVPEKLPDKSLKVIILLYLLKETGVTNDTS